MHGIAEISPLIKLTFGSLCVTAFCLTKRAVRSCFKIDDIKIVFCKQMWHFGVRFNEPKPNQMPDQSSNRRKRALSRVKGGRKKIRDRLPDRAKDIERIREHAEKIKCLIKDIISYFRK